MAQVKATPVEGRRVRKENGQILAATGDTVERNSFWIRRENDGDVTLSALEAEPAPAAETAVKKAAK